jgi:hypothetical protein
LPSSCCRWRSATSRKLAPFSHRSASRIFIRQPGYIPSPMVTQDGDHQFGGGEKQVGLRPLPRPQLQGSSSSLLGRGRAKPKLYLPHGSVGHLLLQHSGERALTGLAEGVDFDNAGPIGRKRHQLQHAWFAGSAGSGTTSGSTSHRWAERGYLLAVRAAVASRAPGDSPRRRTLLGRRSCSWAVLPSLRRDASVRWSVLARPGGLEWGSNGGQVAAIVSAEVVATGEGLVADEIVGAICAPGLRLFGFDSLSSPLEWGRGLGPCRSSLCPEVIAAAVWPPGAEVVVAAAGVGGGEPPGNCRPAGPPMWGGGCSYLRGWNRSSVCNGILSAGVCSLWLSGPEHLGILGAIPCFFLVLSTRARLSASWTA